MINREITYERDINKSYMKIPSVVEACFDEKLIFQKNYSGCIPVEKCYVNGQGQYWYNITGKQALDAYCRVNQIGLTFFETLILRICNQLELLEWNLINTDCLMVDPELIFVNNRGEDISFVLYPKNTDSFFQDLQQLMEYLLTKLNHDEKDAVHAAYKIYEITLSEGYSISDLKAAVLNREKKEKNLYTPIMDVVMEQPIVLQEKNNKEKKCTEEKLWSLKWWEVLNKIKEFLNKRPIDFVEKGKNIIKKKESVPIVVHPEEEPIEEKEIHPTICISAASGGSQGMLIYEGTGGYKDFHLEQQVCLIGKNHRARMQIERETISQFHAKIDYLDNVYYIEDLNSTNGTFVNDRILNYKERKQLQSGDTVRFADVKYRFL